MNSGEIYIFKKGCGGREREGGYLYSRNRGRRDLRDAGIRKHTMSEIDTVKGRDA